MDLRNGKKMIKFLTIFAQWSGGSNHPRELLYAGLAADLKRQGTPQFDFRDPLGQSTYETRLSVCILRCCILVRKKRTV
jgi:hypothetical protein